MQTCVWPSGFHCHSLSLASVKSRFGFTIMVPADPGSPGRRAVKRVCARTRAQHACMRACVHCPAQEFVCIFALLLHRCRCCVSCSVYVISIATDDVRARLHLYSTGLPMDVGLTIYSASLGCNHASERMTTLQSVVPFVLQAASREPIRRGDAFVTSQGATSQRQ